MKTEQKEQTAIHSMEFSESDHAFAEAMAKRLGFTQFAYTSTSALIGIYCLPDNSKQRKGVIVKTPELGFLLIQDLEDLHLYDLH